MPVKQPAAISRFNTLRTFIQRSALLALVVASFGLMLMGKADTYLAERARTALADGVAPLLDVLSRPAETISHVVDNVRELAAIREENARLRAENEKLLRWQSAAQLLESENDGLKNLLNFVPVPEASFATARVVADTGGAFAHSLLVTAGRRDMVEKGQAVVSGQGLIGRIAEAGRRASRVLLITDINSRIPVAIGNARHRAILAGDNTGRPKLLYVKSTQAVSPGDQVRTSGDAGAYPPGLPIGVVAAVRDGEIRVEPFVQRDRLEFVRIIDYGLTGILRDVAVVEKSAKGGSR